MKTQSNRWPAIDRLLLGALAVTAAVWLFYSGDAPVAMLATAPASARSPGAAGCKTSDIVVDKLRSDSSTKGYIKITGRLTSNCADDIGVQIKITTYSKADDIISSRDIWPASIKNIPAKSEWPFEWIDASAPVSRFTVNVIDVKAWR